MPHTTANSTTSDTLSLPPGKARDICERLENAILEHRLPPGMKLVEEEIGEAFGVSRTVARSGLQALAHSGLVTMERNRGACVSKPGTREAHEVFEARALVEPRIARMAASSCTPEGLARLKAHTALEHAAMHAGNKGRALALSGTFHMLIAEIAGHCVLQQILRPLITRSSLIIALYWRRPDTTCESHSHDALIEAFARGDAKAAEDIMRSHIVDLHSGLDLTQKPPAPVKLSDILAP
jgi:DNA-binding GntR family transcriptional regulator